MDRFNINDIENLTGIKAHTLRIWEKRYNFYIPKRKESNHRYYDNDDLRYILKIAYLYNNGYKISKIAALNIGEINNLTINNAQKVCEEQLLINQLLQHAFEFNQDGFEDTLNLSIERLGFEKAILRVVYPYFEKVGLLWMNDMAVPAQEHFSSNMIRNKIIMAIDKLKYHNADTELPVLLFLPEGEFHEIPLLFISYLFKKSRRPFIYYGANTTLEKLKTMSTYTNEFHFYLITNFTGQTIDDYILLLSNTFPSKKIIMSGPMTSKATVKPNNFILLSSLAQTLNYIKKGLTSQYLKEDPSINFP